MSKETEETEETLAKQELYKFKNRRRMAWSAMISMIFFTGILLTNFVTIDRLKAIDSVIEMFYIAMASVVGAYMGFTTWASKR